MKSPPQDRIVSALFVDTSSRNYTGCYRGGVTSANLKRCEKVCTTVVSPPTSFRATVLDQRTCWQRVVGTYNALGNPVDAKYWPTDKDSGKSVTTVKRLEKSIAEMEGICGMCRDQCTGGMFDFWSEEAAHAGEL